MLQELEVANTAKEVANLVSKELTALISGMQITIKEKTEEVVTKLHKKSNELITQAKDTMEEVGKVTTKISNITEKEKPTTTTYRDALTQGITGPPIQVDPWIRAKESIRARQFLWTLSVDVQDLKSVRKTSKLNSLFFFIYFHPREPKHDSKHSQTDRGNSISHACNCSIVYAPVHAHPHSTIKYSKIYVT